MREPKVRGNLGIWHNYSIDEFFSFLFLYLLLVVNSFSFLWINKLLMVVDCFVSLAMTKGKRGGEFFFFSAFVLIISGYGLPQAFGLRNDEDGKGWYSQTRHCENQRFVAISVWGTGTVKQNSSLRGLEKPVAISVILGQSLRNLLCNKWQSRH